MRAFYVAVGVGLAGLMTASASAQINYGDFMGTTVNFFDVTEDASTDALPLFGAPDVNADTLDFDPTDFISVASNGDLDSTIGVLDFGIEAQQGSIIDVIQFREAGDYTIFGTGGAGTEATVSAPVFISIKEVDNVAINPINFNTNIEFSPSDGTYNLADDGVAMGEIWTGALDVDVTQLLIEAGLNFSLGATEVEVILNNILTTTSESGSQAAIQKKEFQISVVPEPGTLALLGLSGLAFLRRR